MSMQQRIEMRNRRADHELQIRVGVSMGDANREEGDYFGPPVVEASRLCAKATGGQVLLPELTRLMVGRRGDHEFRAVGEMELKGLPEPVEVCALAWAPYPATSVPLPPRLQGLPETGYVGRQGLRERLMGLWRPAARGERQVVMLAGEPGIREAIELNIRIGAPRWCIRPRLAWAEMLQRRGTAEDAARAGQLFGEALGGARASGCPALATRAEAGLAATAARSTQLAALEETPE